MGKTREGEQVYIYGSGQSTRYGELIQGLDPDGKTKFIKVNADGAIDTNSIIGFDIGKYDYIALTYVSSGSGVGEIQTVTYKNGGSSGTIQAVLTIVYNASNEISSITKT